MMKKGIDMLGTVPNMWDLSACSQIFPFINDFLDEQNGWFLLLFFPANPYCINTGWWFGTFGLFSHSVGNVIIPTDELHHFSEGQVYHQPVYQLI